MFPSKNVSSRALIALCLCVVLMLPGCGGGGFGRQSKSPGSAVWVGSRSDALTSSLWARLKEAGVEDVFVQAAAFDTQEAELLKPATFAELPTSAPTTMVIGGKLAVDVAGAPALAARLADGLRDLRSSVESKGVLVNGVHLDFLEVSALEAYAEFLKALRQALDKGVFLSISVPRAWLDRGEELKQVVAPVDYLVPFLYGQRLDEVENSAAWDFTALERSVRAVENLDKPFRLGLVTLGSAAHTTASGGIKARITRLSMQDLMRNRSLSLRPGFSLEGANRRVYVLVADRPTLVGEWQLVAGETVRVVRSASADLEELNRLIDVWRLENYLGMVFFRLPNVDERLSMSAESMISLLAPDAATPELRFEANVQRRTGRGYLVRFGVTNASGEYTELALIDNNYLEIRCVNGQFGTNSSAGDFLRYDLFRDLGGGKLERTFRGPEILRLFVPLLEGQQTVMSGDIEVISRGEPRFELIGRFMLPDGQTLEMTPTVFANGKLESVARVAPPANP